CGPLLLYEDDPSNTYTIFYELPSYLTSYYTSSQVYTNINVPDGSGVTELYFPLIPVPTQQVGVYLFPVVGAVVPGTDFQIMIHVALNGNLPFSGMLEFACDPALTIVSVNAPYTATPTGFILDYSLQPEQGQIYTVTLHAPALPAITLGQMLHFNVEAEAPASDDYPDNNSNEMSHIVQGSYDPNDKTENHGPQIRHADFGTDEYLNYTIRFENTGNGNAINVRIEDILNDQLDATTLRTIAASHDYIMERTAETVVWRFNNIQLPPSVENSNIGHGYVHFEVKPKPGFAIGDIIPNNASIYFDTNPAIITNTFETEFVAELSVADFTTDLLRIFPNPASAFSKYLVYNDVKNEKPWYFFDVAEFTTYNNSKEQIIVVNMKDKKVKEYTL
ncbi:MAG: hypothetical protein EOO00_12750, partial [Chitinophagaceae bacterium]